MTMRLFLLEPTPVFKARVNMASISYPIYELTFDGVTLGSITDVQAGMTLLLGTTDGDDNRGRTRVRNDGAAGAVLWIQRSSQGVRDGELYVEDDAYITVVDDYRVWAKIPFIASDGTQYKDHGLVVATNTTNPPPVANAGPGMAGTIDSVTGKLRVKVPADITQSSSFAVADGATISSYLWTLPSGVTLVAGYSTTDNQIEVDCDPGFYWLKLRVTDSNGSVHAARVPIFARDPANDACITGFQIERHRITPKGQELSVRLLEDVARTTYPDGTLVMLWEGEPSSSADRSHMRFVGWHHAAPVSIAAGRTGSLRDTVIECRDVAGKLDALPGFPQSVERSDSPTAWTQMTTPNMDKYLHYLLHWHSTALEVADWRWTSTTTSNPFVVMGSHGQSLWHQVEQRAQALVPDYHLTCNRLGQLLTTWDPMLVDLFDRLAKGVQATIAVDDWSQVRFTAQRVPRYHWLRGSAILAHATEITPLFCIAPGTAPGQGEQPYEHGEQLAQSQADLNECEGWRYARLNAPESHWTITLVGDVCDDIDPAYYNWVRVQLTEDLLAQRGWPWWWREDIGDYNRGLVHELTIRYEYRRGGIVKSAEIVWEREVYASAWGPAAVTVYSDE